MAFIPSTAERARRIRLPHPFFPLPPPFALAAAPSCRKRKGGRGRRTHRPQAARWDSLFFGFYQPTGVRTLLVQLHVRAGASRLATASGGGRKQRHLAQRACDVLKGRQKGREKEQSSLTYCTLKSRAPSGC